MIRAYFSRARQFHFGSCTIFIVFLMFCFLRCYTLSAFVEAEIQSVFVWSEIHNPVPSRYCDVTTARTDVKQLCYRLSLLPYWSLRQSKSALNIGRNDNASRFAVGGIRFFIVFFLIIFFFNFMPVPFLVLIFIAAQTAAASISVLFSKYFVRRVSVRSLLWKYRVLSTLCPIDLCQSLF